MRKYMKIRNPRRDQYSQDYAHNLLAHCVADYSNVDPGLAVASIIASGI